MLFELRVGRRIAAWAKWMMMLMWKIVFFVLGQSSGAKRCKCMSVEMKMWIGVL